APNLTQMIAECARGVLAANGTAGKTGKEVQDVLGGKEVKSVAEVQPVNSAPAYAPADIRGVYLIQPSLSAIVTQECVAVVKKKTPPKHQPQSPSTAVACP